MSTNVIGAVLILFVTAMAIILFKSYNKELVRDFFYHLNVLKYLVEEKYPNETVATELDLFLSSAIRLGIMTKRSHEYRLLKGNPRNYENIYRVLSELESECSYLVPNYQKIQYYHPTLSN